MGTPERIASPSSWGSHYSTHHKWGRPYKGHIKCKVCGLRILKEDKKLHHEDCPETFTKFGVDPYLKVEEEENQD